MMNHPAGNSATSRIADPEQLAVLQHEVLIHGVEAWNEWRRKHPTTSINLQEADLSRRPFREANFSYAQLRGALFQSSDLGDANFDGADLTGANLSEANLTNARLTGTNLVGTDLTRCSFGQTVFGDTDLSAAQGLDSCWHFRGSTLDFGTIAKSRPPLPLAFLRGVGLSDRLIEYLPSLFGETLQFYACFISYSARDDEFTRRLHADLQDRGVRCWFAPEDLKTGARIRHGIDEAIRVHDKLLLILSEHSIASQWVEQEVEDALEQERQTGKTILFPIRLDDAVMTITSGWPRLLRNTRNIGDMRQWKDHDAYQIVLDRLLRDLRTENAAPAPRTEA